MWRPRGALKRRYDVVVVGAGSHGLATAYYLASGTVSATCASSTSRTSAPGRGRNTTIIRSNYRTPEGAEFYRESVRLYERLSAELDFNLMFSQHGHHARALGSRAVTMQERAEVEPAARDQVTRRRPAGSQGALPAARRVRPALVPDYGRVTTRRAGSSATMLSSGACPRCGRARGRDPPRHRGDGLRAERRSHVASRRRAAASSAGRSYAPPPAGHRSSPGCARATPDHDAHSPGVRDRADEAVSRRDHRVLAAHVHLADRPRRVPDWRGDRAVHDLQGDRRCPPRVLGQAHARALPQLERIRVLRTWTGLCDLSPDYSPLLGKTWRSTTSISPRGGERTGSRRRRSSG